MKTFEQIQEEILSELSGKTLVGYIQKATAEGDKQNKIAQGHMKTLHKLRMIDNKLEDPKNKEYYTQTHAHARKAVSKHFRRTAGLKRAYRSLEKK
jgi:hypothetical protein